MQATKQRRAERQKGGRVTRADREAVILAAGGKCQRCGGPVPNGAGHVDRIIPLARGGTHQPMNLQFLCAPCNLTKGSKLEEEICGSGKTSN